MADELLWALVIMAGTAFSVLVYVVLSEVYSRREGPVMGGPEGVDEERPIERPVKKETSPSPPEKETEQQRLKRREKELAEREARVKAEKLKRLAEREHVIRRREEEEAAAKAQQKVKSQPGDREWIESEKQRIQELIHKAEERFNAGGLTEDHFKKIVAEYQNQLIDLDIRLKRASGGV
ncbi:MAG: hypothetical protein GF416_04220 [Candidatus Altiarchaeales archaeon]|nr:hypothetical protein [Candidatus Altiarchaeales archaeon]MBD3416326.1 hypothetical protein [Candidatus Altiarchaeales archaeon]